MGVSWADNSVKIRLNLPFSNPNPDLHTINAHTKFGENPLMFTQVIILKRKKNERTEVRLREGRAERYTDVQRETVINTCLN